MQTQIQFIEVERMSRPQARQKTDTVMTVMSEMLVNVNDGGEDLLIHQENHSYSIILLICTLG